MAYLLFLLFHEEGYPEQGHHDDGINLIAETPLLGTKFKVSYVDGSAQGGTGQRTEHKNNGYDKHGQADQSEFGSGFHGATSFLIFLKKCPKKPQRRPGAVKVPDRR